MRSSSAIGRVAALGAMLAAAVLVALVLFGGGGPSYKVKGTFLNASQLVKGNLVQVGGTQAGQVTDIDVTKNGQALITFEVDGRYAPLKRGTKATIRQASQSGIANRYVDLEMPPGDPGEEIPDGGEIGVDETTTGVDLDQFFDIFDKRTRRSLQRFLRGSARQYAGRGAEANRGYQYLSPGLSTSSRLFNELNRDTPALEHFVVDSAKLVSALAERRDDLAALIGNLNTTTRAIGNEKVALADAIGRLPDFMRRSNTTFVNLRGALDDVDPLVDASKPVVRKLGPFLDELRPFARDARPTVRDLSAIIRRPGTRNDLVELTRTFQPLADIAVDPARRTVDAGGTPVDVGETDGAFPTIAKATTDTAPIIAFGRPYTPDLFGWFDDFSNTGNYDALGGFSRAQVYFNAFTVQANGLPAELSPTERPDNFRSLANIGQFKRCPGASEARAEDGSNVFSAEEQQELDCVEAHRAVRSRR